MAVDGGRKTITVTSSRAQTELGEWIFQLLESAPPRSGSSEYTMPGNSDDVVRVAFLSRRTGPRELQEVINAVRSIVEVQRIGAVTAAGAVVLRGTVRQGNLADWLIQQLENPPAGASPGSYTAAGLDPTFHNRGLAEPNAVRVYSMSPERTPDLQAALEEIRNQVQVMRIVACPGARVIVLRGTEAQAQGADRILMKTGK